MSSAIQQFLCMLIWTLVVAIPFQSNRLSLPSNRDQASARFANNISSFSPRIITEACMILQSRLATPTQISKFACYIYMSDCCADYRSVRSRLRSLCSPKEVKTANSWLLHSTGILNCFVCIFFPQILLSHIHTCVTKLSICRVGKRNALSAGKLSVSALWCCLQVDAKTGESLCPFISCAMRELFILNYFSWYMRSTICFFSKSKICICVSFCNLFNFALCSPISQPMVYFQPHQTFKIFESLHIFMHLLNLFQMRFLKTWSNASEANSRQYETLCKLN